ncbi:MAG: hypothetical protein IPN02_05955 [Candidatus Microthrix sp.]|uniref:Uncharacterized protein n=1 Tax=Candidatus Neomicrothrix subdominans TaxID=2954438 RepID=A0A936TCM6_9ACTN|nr:hypothetical protein [Candidatus Microthrix subdominans]
MSTLRWTLKSTYELSREVTDQGFEASAELVRRLLAQNGYSLQAPAKSPKAEHILIVTASSITSPSCRRRSLPLVTR